MSDRDDDRERRKFTSDSSQEKWGLWAGAVLLFVVPISLILGIFGQ